MNKLSANVTRLENLMSRSLKGKETECGKNFGEAVQIVTKREGFTYFDNSFLPATIDNIPNDIKNDTTIDPKDKKSLEIVENYRAYTDFKTSKFCSSEDPKYNDNGQIYQLYFKMK